MGSGFLGSGCLGFVCSASGYWGPVCSEFGCSGPWGSGYLGFWGLSIWGMCACSLVAQGLGHLGSQSLGVGGLSVGGLCARSLGAQGPGGLGIWDLCAWGPVVLGAQGLGAGALGCTGSGHVHPSRADGVQGVWGLWGAGHMGSGHCGLWDHQAPGVLPLGHQGSAPGLCHSRQLRYRCPWGSPDFPLLLKWGTPSVHSMRLVGEIARRELRCHISLQPSLRSRLGPWGGREGRRETAARSP